MRVSIWRQFSGNHSSGFVMIGVFATVEAAERAADALRQILDSIAAWSQSPEGARWGGLSREPRPPEIELADQYGFSWNERIDWDLYPEHLDALVQVIDRTILIHGPQEFASEKPADAFLRHLGGKVWVMSDEEGGELVVDLRCVAPDENAAASVVDNTQSYLDFIDRRWAESDLGSIYPARAPVRSALQDGTHIRIEGYPARGVEELLADLIGKGCTELDYYIRESYYYGDDDEPIPSDENLEDA
jgi:hypothetical protein